MKNILLLFFYSISFFISAQNNEYIGHYETIIKTKGGETLEYKLDLKADNTFIYHFYRNLGQTQSIDENWYGKGTWKVKNNIVYFFTDKLTDLDQKYNLDFTNTTGRFDTKNKSLFRFYKSNIPWIKKSTVSKIN
ncbi:MAG: hypothetical protein HC854_16830 [Flavobacterium sp.]|nr:hypothetical protein [Flavobacterium sp.]